MVLTAQRIVSLVPSATETVFRLGLGGHLVGRSHACNEPAEALAVPALTAPQLGGLGENARASRTIHDSVRQRLSDGLAIYEVDVEKLRALAPTHLLIQDQCSVCAVAPGDLEKALTDWLGEAPQLVVSNPHQLRDVWDELETIGRALGREPEAKSLACDLNNRLADLAKSLDSRIHAARKPRVACIEWLDPIMISGHWVPELVRIAGGEPLLAETGGASRVVSLDDLLGADPDVVVVQACGFDLATSEREWLAHPEIETTLRAHAARRERPIRIVLTDGDAFFNRPGPRLVESAEILRRTIHLESSMGEEVLEELERGVSNSWRVLAYDRI